MPRQGVHHEGHCARRCLVPGEQHAEHVVHDVLVAQPAAIGVDETRQTTEQVMPIAVSTPRHLGEKSSTQPVASADGTVVARTGQLTPPRHQTIKHTHGVRVDRLATPCRRESAEDRKADVQGQTLCQPVCVR